MTRRTSRQLQRGVRPTSPATPHFHEVEGETEADQMRDAFVSAVGREPNQISQRLERVDRATRTQVVNRLQREHGNAYVQRVVAGLSVQRQPELHVTTGTTEELQAELDRLLTEVKTVTNKAEQKKYAALIEKLRSRIAERGDSTLTEAPFSLEFDGKYLALTGAESVSFPAVSGRPDASGDFDYSSERQKLEGVGPIPEGMYWLDPEQLKSLWYYTGDAAAAWGSHRITIHPFGSTHTFGRGGFFIHGGSTPGSAGCIDLTGRMGDLAKIIQKYKNVKIILTVKYPVLGDFPTPTGDTRAV